MLKVFSNNFNRNLKPLHKYISKFNFARKIFKEGGDLQAADPVDDIKGEVYEQGGKKLDYIKVYKGVYPYMPLDDHPLIPGYARMIAVSKEITDKLKEVNAEKTKMVLSVLRNPEKVEALQTSMTQMSMTFIPDIKTPNEVYDVGVLCDVKIREQKEFGQGLLIRPLSICKIEEFTIMPTPVGQVKVTVYKEENISELDIDMEMSIKYQYLKNLLAKAMETSKDENFKRLIMALAQNFNTETVNELIYLCISSLSLPKFFHKYGFLLLQFKSRNIQELIEVIDIKERLEKTTRIFSEFCNKIELWERLEDEYDVKRERSKATEKLRSIFESLKNMFEQETDEKNIQMERFKKNLEGKIVPDHIMKIIKEEMERFMSMDKHSMESNVIRNYLDVLTSLPYGISTIENLDIAKAREIINETHYGMEDIKERILEAIAVGKLKGKIQGKILCFVGPPGVGKTSIGESIARSLNRKFIRISLGGDRDTSSLKGFRRTYVGAIPGKIVKALKTAGSENPLILLDEIDKLGERSVQGDPSSVLLEVLDPEQNNSFSDDYLDTTIDLSKVFFLCTANSVANIHQALYDRMEIIEVAGYTFNEKKFIFEKYLRPRAIKNAGLDSQPPHNFGIEDDAVNKLINYYCRESGVRSLQRYTNRIYEKIAMRIVQNETDVLVTTDNLKKFVGQAHFSSKRIYDLVPRGVSIGLGYNDYGGTILYVESSKANFTEKTTGQYSYTGNVGKVMGESCNIGLTYAKFFMNSYFSNSEDKKLKTFFDDNHIHIHFTEGAISKDGPSAGVTIATALISLALNKPMTQDLAMTGELSLCGKVLAIGGVKEKVMAGQREGMKTLIFPKANRDDIEDLPDYIKQGLTIHYAEDYIDVFRICFPDVEVNYQSQY